MNLNQKKPYHIWTKPFGILIALSVLSHFIKKYLRLLFILHQKISQKIMKAIYVVKYNISENK